MAKISLDLLERVRIPLVIGTAGHSDIRTAETVENAVKSVFEEITKPVPHTPILLLSPLGIGSERLIARVALDHLKKPPGVKIIVPMPVPRWLYESDFQSQADRKLFEGATYHFAVHLAKENTEENIVETRARSLQDKAAGVYVTRHCQILIALWNGQAGDTKQGDAPRLDWTSELVRFQLDGTSAEVRQRMIPCERELLHSQYELAEWGPVYCVPVQRESDSTETTQPGCSPFVLLYPKVFKEDGAAGHYEKVFKNLDQYNKDVENSGGLHEGYCASKKELLPVGDAMELSPALQFLLDRYAVADALANRFQAKFRHRQEAVHSLIWCALLFFELFAYFLERERQSPNLRLVLIGSSLGCVGLGMLLSRHTKQSGVQDKYQDYRCLAEGMRVQFFWRLAGLEESVANHYLGRVRTELDWVRNAIRNWNIPAAQKEGEFKPHISAVLEHWINKQRKYFTVKRGEALKPWAHLLTFIAVLIAVITGVAAALFPSEPASWILCAIKELIGRLPFESPKGVAIVVIVMLLGTAALLDHYIDKMGYEERSKQCERMEAIFSYAESRIFEAEEKSDQASVRDSIFDLGITALEENGSWVLMGREHPLEVPKIA